VVVKVADPDIVHKTDRGLVVSDLPTAADVLSTVTRFYRTLAVDAAPILVKRQVTGGVELAVGMVRDPMFGPLVMVAADGLGTRISCRRFAIQQRLRNARAPGRPEHGRHD
jgi:acyl-CoA synthetase (NDP forming)